MEKRALPDLEAWAVFASVAEHKSFSAAADSIGVSKAKVSKAVARLEAHLGQSLFHRTSRRLSLTAAGKPLAERAARILAESRSAEDAAFDGATEPAGRVRLAAPMTFGITHVAPVIPDFLKAYPRIELDLNLSDARIDIVAGGFDVALRIASLNDSSMRARRLRDVSIHLVAAPSYLRERGMPTHPGQLSEHRLLEYANVSDPWHFRDAGGEDIAIRPNGPLRANSGEAMLPSLVAGIGIARLPDFMIREHLDSGELVSILQDWAPPAVGLHLITPPSTLRPARVEALISFLSERLRVP